MRSAPSGRSWFADGRDWRGLGLVCAIGAPAAALDGARASPPGAPVRPQPAVVGPSGYALRLVPAGAAAVGCTAGQGGACGRDERPVREVVVLHGILVGEHEVTQGLYQRLMGHNPAHFTACGARCPVEQVSWFDAAAFANRLSAAEGLEACYLITESEVTWAKGLDCVGFRLPTEDEWEVAARGGRDDRYAGGDSPETLGWFGANSGDAPHPVGQKAANPYGLFDLTGNVSEWVWDGYVAERSAVGASVGEPLRAPGEPAPHRGVRGGSWGVLAAGARVSNRSHHAPDARVYDVGLRLVRRAP